MAITQNTFNGDGSNLGPFSFTFKWLEPTDIKVTVSGVLKTAGTHYNLQSLNYATKSGGQVLFTAGNAPAVGTGNIVVYRQTDDSDLSATFNSGSAIRAQDLNDNFIQGLYVTQESSNNATTAISTAEGAVTTANAATATANSAVSTANAATATANTAASDAAAAVSTANTASTNASAAVATANTASTNASAAVSTANSAAADAATAISTANGAVTTANSAAADATTAISTANTASSNASAAVATANTASTNASNAVTTANTASTTASNAVTTANSAVTTANAADSKADQAISAVANALLFTIVANVAAIPASPADGDAVEITDATGIESFTPLSGIPSGFVGDSGLGVRLIYQSAGSTWIWLQYFPQDPDNRYAGPNTAAGTAAAPSIAFGPTDTNTGIFSPGADELALVTGGTARLTIDSTGSVNIPVLAPNIVDAGYVNIYNDSVFYDADASNYIGFKAPTTVASNVTFTLPTGDGTNGQALSTDGTGSLGWITPLVPSDIGTTVQAYDATTLKSADIGTSVQGYDADTAKTDVAQTFTAQQTFGELKETTFTLGTTGSIALDPANGSIQSSVLTGAPTFTDSLEAGQTIVLMLEGGASYTVTWPTITWVTSGGNVAPTLTANDTLVFWKVSTTLYGAYVGSYV